MKRMSIKAGKENDMELMNERLKILLTLRRHIIGLLKAVEELIQLEKSEKAK